MSLRCLRTQLAHAAVADAAGLEASADYTMSLCVRINTAPTAGQKFVLLGKGDITDATSQGNYGIVYQNTAGTLQLVAGHYDTGGTQRIVTITQTLTVGKWYALAYSYNDTSKAIETYLAALEWRGTAGATTYTNIDSDTLGGSPKSANADELLVGVGTDGTSLQNGSDADICEVAGYSAVLSSGTLDGRLGTRLAGTEANLLFYYPCNEEKSTSLYDRSGNGLDGTLNRKSGWSDDPTDLTWTTGLYSKGVIVYGNALWHPATSYAGSDDDTSYPSSRLRSPRQQLTTRTNDVTGAKTWTFTLGRRQPVACLILEGHNLTSAATITIAAHTSDAWGAPALTAETVTFHPTRLVHWFARPWAYDFWRLSITDAANGDGYIELGTVILGLCWEGNIYAPLGEAEQVTDTSVLVSTPHGDTTARDLTRHRSASAAWSVLRRETALELRRLLELYGPGYIAVAPDPQRRGINGITYGAVTQLPVYQPSVPSWHYTSAGALTVEADF